MAMATGINGVEFMEDGRLHVDLYYHQDTRESTIVALYIERDRFLDWDKFSQAVEERAPTKVEAGCNCRWPESTLRKDWEYWKARIEGGEK